jgi:hypothetical protein
MNHFFEDITWFHYAELLVSALVVYYLYVGLRWYRAEFNKFFRVGRWRSAVPQLPQPTDVDGTEEITDNISMGTRDRLFSPRELETLTTALLGSIAEAGGRPYEPVATIQKLKAIIRSYPHLGNSPQRGAINRLVVTECKKNGIARLSEQEVDEWWQQ